MRNIFHREIQAVIEIANTVVNAAGNAAGG